jgi:hypothetical protein
VKATIEILETNSDTKIIRDLYRGISNFRKGYQPRTNIARDEKGDLVTSSQVGKPESKALLERHRHRWEDNIKMDL